MNNSNQTIFSHIVTKPSGYGVLHILCPTACQLIQLVSYIMKTDVVTTLSHIELGTTYVNEKRVSNPDFELQVNDTVRLHTQPRRFSTSYLKDSTWIIEDHSEFVVINKPSGIPCIPTVDNLLENTLYSLTKKLNCNIFVTSRLDVATNGLLVYAKTKSFQSLYNKALELRQVQKIYTARVSNLYTADTQLKHFMEPSIRAPKQVTQQPQAGWLECRLDIISNIFDALKNESTLTIKLLTGRTHQIRAQLSEVGFPILGDTLYGSSTKISKEVDQIALTCSQLQFDFEPYKGKTFRLN